MKGRLAFGDMVKVVVDLERGVLSLGGEPQADGEGLLLLDGSRQAERWGARRLNERLAHSAYSACVARRFRCQ